VSEVEKPTRLQKRTLITLMVPASLSGEKSENWATGRWDWVSHHLDEVFDESNELENRRKVAEEESTRDALHGRVASMTAFPTPVSNPRTHKVGSQKAREHAESISNAHVIHLCPRVTEDVQIEIRNGPAWEDGGGNGASVDIAIAGVEFIRSDAMASSLGEELGRRASNGESKGKPGAAGPEGWLTLHLEPRSYGFKGGDRQSFDWNADIDIANREFDRQRKILWNVIDYLSARLAEGNHPLDPILRSPDGALHQLIDPVLGTQDHPAISFFVATVEKRQGENGAPKSEHLVQRLAQTYGQVTCTKGSYGFFSTGRERVGHVAYSSPEAKKDWDTEWRGVCVYFTVILPMFELAAIQRYRCDHFARSQSDESLISKGKIEWDVLRAKQDAYYVFKNLFWWTRFGSGIETETLTAIQESWGVQGVIEQLDAEFRDYGGFVSMRHEIDERARQRRWRMIVAVLSAVIGTTAILSTWGTLRDLEGWSAGGAVGWLLLGCGIGGGASYLGYRYLSRDGA
jgi:hypothetical protein